MSGTSRGPLRCLLAAGAWLAVLATAGGCAGTAATGSGATRPEVRAPARPAAVSAFEARQRAEAEAAQQQGRLADALWAWDIVLALAPNDAAAAKQRAELQAQAEAGAAERVARARQAQQRGDHDAAVRLNLEALALLPGPHPTSSGAAEALREIERERTKRGNVVGFRAAQVLQRGPMAAERNELEHAAMLAGQGELDAAIGTLEPVVARRPSDAAARNALADLLVRRAERQQPNDLPGAVAALERALQLVPGHRGASARLKAWRP